ncbi:MAG: hypothetical protein HMLIMOIP_001902 [Candidatus Nitrosomirales archaeon]|jgi:hypothetical protein
MVFTASLWDIGIWLAASSIIVLVTSEVVSPRYGRINMLMNFNRMRKIAVMLGIVFLLVASLNILSIV